MKFGKTVEEIRRSPVEVGNVSHYLSVFYIRGGAGFCSIKSMIIPKIEDFRIFDSILCIRGWIEIQT